MRLRCGFRHVLDRWREYGYISHCRDEMGRNPAANPPSSQGTVQLTAMSRLKPCDTVGDTFLFPLGFFLAPAGPFSQWGEGGTCCFSGFLSGAKRGHKMDRNTQELSLMEVETACRLCGYEDTSVVQYQLNGGYPVCYICAETIANVWNYTHLGRYISWRNKEVTNVRYTKKIISSSLRWEVLQRDNFTCKHCGSRKHLEADHVIPESNGGETTMENLQTLCKKCNAKKGKGGLQ